MENERVFIAFVYNGEKQLLVALESEVENLLEATKDLPAYHRALTEGEFMHEDQVWHKVHSTGYSMRAYQQVTLKS